MSLTRWWRPLLISAALILFALLAPAPADAQVVRYRVTEVYWYWPFVGPQLPPYVTGECTRECDGTYWCWGYQSPWSINWVETIREECPPIYWDTYASAGPRRSTKALQVNREKYAREPLAFLAADRTANAGAPLRAQARGCTSSQLALVHVN